MDNGFAVSEPGSAQDHLQNNHCNDWKQIQTTIDKFIKAGLESFLIHDQREENASDNFCSKISPTVTASSTLR